MMRNVDGDVCVVVSRKRFMNFKWQKLTSLLWFYFLFIIAYALCLRVCVCTCVCECVPTYLIFFWMREEVEILYKLYEAFGAF